jgi:Subtilase family
MSTPYTAYDTSHGTAVAGIIGGDINDFGVQGIAPNAQYWGSSTWDPATNQVSIPKAIMNAMDKASPGDVILLEQQGYWEISQGISRYLPVEWWPLIYDVVKYATGKGMVVIEAAANGDGSLNGIDLMDQTLQASRLVAPLLSYGSQWDDHLGKPLGTPNPFDPQNENSGAVIVGAGFGGGNSRPDRSRLDFSNYGDRVDVQGQGYNVVSTGISSNCDLVPSNPGDNRVSQEYSVWHD